VTWIVDQWELQYVYPPSHNKFYRILLYGNGVSFPESTELRVVTQWGRIGTDGQNRVQIFTSYYEAVSLVDKTRHAKAEKGYVYTICKESIPAYPDVLRFAGITDTTSPVVEQVATVAAVETEIVDLLTEISELNAVKAAGKKVPKNKYTDLMNRYAELVQRSEEVTTESSESAERTRQAISMAFTGVMNLGVTV
jgi:predicted DNA-binding WGR domain protein